MHSTSLRLDIPAVCCFLTFQHGGVSTADTHCLESIDLPAPDDDDHEWGSQPGLRTSAREQADMHACEAFRPVGRLACSPAGALAIARFYADRTHLGGSSSLGFGLTTCPTMVGDTETRRGLGALTLDGFAAPTKTLFSFRRNASWLWRWIAGFWGTMSPSGQVKMEDSRSSLDRCRGILHVAATVSPQPY
ncbi:hypothetical protein FN846DRAFT_474617 [Sphaerosporella brunnea]|uniref:Uncharacterized protein n=1 Tax=Sphaerosporella brunnea TaxID=1250544 RepID=A0A5J5EF00_9PEZI|nr:hypothetical protein FN846DRAFT_474617 [Sphaerosporella brunnea]